jgi:hypothetical protein
VQVSLVVHAISGGFLFQLPTKCNHSPHNPSMSSIFSKPPETIYILTTLHRNHSSLTKPSHSSHNIMKFKSDLTPQKGLLLINTVQMLLYQRGLNHSLLSPPSLLRRKPILNLLVRKLLPRKTPQRMLGLRSLFTRQQKQRARKNSKLLLLSQFILRRNHHLALVKVILIKPLFLMFLMPVKN